MYNILTITNLMKRNLNALYYYTINMTSNQENIIKWKNIIEEIYQVKDEGNDIQVGMDDFICNTNAMEGLLLHAFQHNELGDDIDISNTIFQIMKYTPTPLIAKNKYIFEYCLDNILMTHHHTYDT